MGLMDAMIGYKKKDPYEEALAQRPRSPCGSTKKSPRVIAGTPASRSGPIPLNFAY